MLKPKPSSRPEQASPLAGPDEPALIRAIAAGERSALETLYRHYRSRLGRFLARQTRRQDVIEEVINDTFWIVWRQAEGFRGESRVSTWIMGIAYRCMLKNLRDRGDPGVGEVSLEDLAQPFCEPFVEHEQADWVAKGLARLPAEQRATLELAYGLGHSLDEIAAIMVCPLSTVKARMFHARIKLRNLLPALSDIPQGVRQELATSSARDWKEYDDED